MLIKSLNAFQVTLTKLGMRAMQNDFFQQISWPAWARHRAEAGQRLGPSTYFTELGRAGTGKSLSQSMRTHCSELHWLCKRLTSTWNTKGTQHPRGGHGNKRGAALNGRDSTSRVCRIHQAEQHHQRCWLCSVGSGENHLKGLNPHSACTAQ